MHVLAAAARRGQVHHREGAYSGTGPSLRQSAPGATLCWRCGKDLVQGDDGWRVLTDGAGHLPSTWLPYFVTEAEWREFAVRAPYLCETPASRHEPQMP